MSCDRGLPTSAKFSQELVTELNMDYWLFRRFEVAFVAIYKKIRERLQKELETFQSAFLCPTVLC